MELDDRTGSNPGAGSTPGAGPVEAPPLLTTSDMLNTVLQDLTARYKTRQGGGWTGGLRCGFPLIDKNLRGLRPKSTTSLAAEPNIGKSTLANQIAYQAAAFTGQRVISVVASFENDPDNLLLKHLSRLSGWRVNDLEAGEVSPDDPQLLNAVRMVERTPIFYLRGNSATTPDVLINRVQEARDYIEGDVDVLLVIDYLQLYARYFSGRTAMEQISMALPEMRRIGNETNAALLFIVSQNRKANEKGSSTMYGARGSGEIEYDADTMLTLTKEERSAPAGQVPLLLSAVKTRYGGAGTSSRLNFDPNLAYFDPAVEF